MVGGWILDQILIIKTFLSTLRYGRLLSAVPRVSEKAWCSEAQRVSLVT